MAANGNSPLSGKAAIITGASAGIGQAVARHFIQAGANLVLVARRAERLEQLAAEAKAAGVRAVPIVGDVREEETAQKAVEAALASFGRIDVLVNNAGIGIYKNLAETSLRDYDEMMDTNMRSTFIFSHHAVPVLIQQRAGMIINISSMAGVMGFPGEAVYCSTKFAQVGFTQALDRELRPYDIKVGVVCPGGVKTEFAIGTGRTEADVAESGMLEAEDVASAVMLMVTQSSGSRVMEIRMRPMVEPLAGRDPE